MADTYSTIINSDGSADVTVVFDTTGTGLPSCNAANSTVFHLDPPDSGSAAWTSTTASAAVQTEAEAQKQSWIQSLGGTATS